MLNVATVAHLKKQKFGIIIIRSNILGLLSFSIFSIDSKILSKIDKGYPRITYFT